jgi:hypothetical protein
VYLIRSPTGTDDKFNGTWNDSSTKWTPFKEYNTWYNYSTEVPYKNANDGFFFINTTEFLKNF